jgi:hypothetical protein
MNKAILSLMCGLWLAGVSVSWAQWHDALDDASGTYSYSRTPYWHDGATVTFNTTGETMVDADLLDGAGLFSRTNIAGKKVLTVGSDYIAKIPWSSSLDSTTITFALNNPVEIKQFYVQVPFNVDAYSLPAGNVQFQYSDDNGTTWNDFGQTSSWIVCSDNTNSKYCILELPQQVKKRNIRLIVYSPVGYNTYIDEIEFRYIKWKDTLDNASGSYSYSRVPYWNDSGTMTFNTCGDNTTSADLLDGAGLYSRSNLAGWATQTVGSSHTAKIPWSSSNETVITFNLDVPVEIREFYVQTSCSSSYDAFLTEVKFQYSDDNGTTWQDFGQTNISAVCYDNSSSRYFTFDLPQLVKKKNIQIIAYSPPGYNIFIDEVEFRVPKWPLIFDWEVRPEISFYSNGIHPFLVDITPVPMPGIWDYDPYDSMYSTFYSQMFAQGRFATLCLLNSFWTGPVNGNDLPAPDYANTLSTIMGVSQHMDFVFADFEEDDSNTPEIEMDQDTREMVHQVRENTNPEIKNAYIGNFDDFPGAIDVSWSWPNQSDQTARHNFYMTSGQGFHNGTQNFNVGLNVAQPHLYQVAYYARHADSSVWRTTHYYSWDILELFPYYTYENVAPNVRSALFWAPLEKYSTAKRALPQGHLLIPYVGAFWDYEDPGDTQPLPHEDVINLLLHVRLRGSDGYYGYWANYTDGDPTWTNEEFIATMYKTWKSLDWLLDTDGSRQILNLTTSKNTGLQWSCTITDKGYAILISNLNTVSQNFTYPSQLASYGKTGTISVAANTHILQTTLNP